MDGLFRRCYDRVDKYALNSIVDKVKALNRGYYEKAMESLPEQTYSRVLDAVAYCYARYAYENKSSFSLQTVAFIDSDIRLHEYEKSIGTKILSRLSNNSMNVLIHKNGYSIEFCDRLWYIDNESDDIITEPLLVCGMRLNRTEYYSYELFSCFAVVLNVMRNNYSQHDLNILDSFISDICSMIDEVPALSKACVVLREYYLRLPFEVRKVYINGNFVYLDGKVYEVELPDAYEYIYLRSFTEEFEGMHIFRTGKRGLKSTSRLVLDEVNMLAYFILSTAIVTSEEIYTSAMRLVTGSKAFRKVVL